MEKIKLEKVKVIHDEKFGDYFYLNDSEDCKILCDLINELQNRVEFLEGEVEKLKNDDSS